MSDNLNNWQLARLSETRFTENLASYSTCILRNGNPAVLFNIGFWAS